MENLEMKLDEADRQSEITEDRLFHETVFRDVRRIILENKSF